MFLLKMIIYMARAYIKCMQSVCRTDTIGRTEFSYPFRNACLIIIIMIISRSDHCWPMASPTSISICSLFLTSRSHLPPSQYHPATFLLVSLYFFLIQVSTLYCFRPICHSPFSQGVPPKTISLHLFFHNVIYPCFSLIHSFRFLSFNIALSSGLI